MARWEPNARERLVEAAMALFEERGYEHTTVSDIVARAGLKDRSFFRYFSDKREVLFSGGEAFDKLIVDAAGNAPKTATPREVVLAAIDALAPLFEAGRPFARRRLALIASHPELQERELAKSNKLAATLAGCFRARNLSAATADLLAMTAMVLFQNALERWVNDPKKRELKHHVRKAFSELRVLAAKSETATRTPKPTPRS